LYSAFTLVLDRFVCRLFTRRAQILIYNYAEKLCPGPRRWSTSRSRSCATDGSSASS
jgi:hypothetical protein